MISLKKGLLIVFEGVDGCGKTTLIEEVYNFLINLNYPIIKTKEPGGTDLGLKLKDIIFSSSKKVCTKAEYLLFAADRAQHFEEIVIPSLLSKKIIISDRMSDSSLVYQGYVKGVDLGLINCINKWVMKNIEPDITFYLRVAPKCLINRLIARDKKRSKFESDVMKNIEKIVSWFDAVMLGRKDVIVIDGNREKKLVLSEIKNVFLEKIKTFDI